MKYQFDISYIQTQKAGKSVQAMAIAGQIPGPTIEATLGDVIDITFNNKMDVDTSIHWHGILLPNDQDGVPYLTTQPIAAGKSFSYRFRVKHSGTYWYHSHTGLQEQRGIYGSIVFHPRNPKLKVDHEYVVLFSDWSNEKPNRILAHLKHDGDYYALKKNSVQSWAGAAKHGWSAIKQRIKSSWTRMGPMDISDVGYDAFLANGNLRHHYLAYKGEKLKLRLINGSASSYFLIEYAGGDMTVVAADGVDVKPFKTKQLRIAIAETYDVIVKVPENKSYELRSTAEDISGYSSTFIGNGSKVFAPDIPRPNLYTAHENHMQHTMNDYEQL